MKTILTLVLVLISYTSMAQWTVTTDVAVLCDWDEEKREFVNCVEKEFRSKFFFNKNNTSITHTTEDRISVYYIDEIEISEDQNVVTHYVTSDTGNSYTVLLSGVSNTLGFLSYSDDGEAHLIQFQIKATF